MAIPETASVVEGHLDGVGEVGKLPFGGEEFDPVSLRHGHGGQRLSTIFVLQGAVLAAGFVVGLDLWQGMSLRVSGLHVEGAPLEGRPDGLVADGGHFFEFLELVRIIGRTEGAVPSPEDVDSVWES